ncbi:MAG: alpha/beta fold hydrolase [Alphaproteobacteria bacterium]|nr:alpha/beta fold hydrolase [Alphaproteobacteria bacterium]
MSAFDTPEHRQSVVDYDTWWRLSPAVARAYVDTRFGQVHFRFANPATPRRRPILCFHASPMSGRIYDMLLAELGEDRVAIAPDNPCFGDSDVMAREPEIPDFAAAMGDLVDALGLTAFDVMGYHTGSKIAVEMARQRPHQVGRLVLVSAPVYTEEELAEYRGVYAAHTADDAGQFLLDRWAMSLKYADPKKPLALIDRDFMEAGRGGSHIMHWGHRASHNYQHKTYLPQVQHPILVLCPEDDLWVPTRRARPYLKNGSILELPGRAHGFLALAPKETAGTLRQFLDRERPAETAAPITVPSTRGEAGRQRRGFVSGRFGQIHFRQRLPDRSAAAPPLVCLHMAPLSGKQFASFIDSMGKDRVCLAFDTPGFGESTMPTRPPSVENYAEALADAARSLLGPGAFDLLGDHTGASIAVAMALAHPETVRKVVMSSLPVFTPEEKQARAKFLAPPIIQRNGRHLLERWRIAMSRKAPGIDNHTVTRNFLDGARSGPLLWWSPRATYAYDKEQRIPDMRQEALLLNPHDDLTRETARAAGLLGRGAMIELPNMGHAIYDVNVQELCRIISSFLR